MRTSPILSLSDCVQRAAIAAAPTYVTSQRAKVVDFTESFMPVHATILIRNNHSHPSNFFRPAPSTYPTSGEAEESPHHHGSSNTAGGIRSAKDLVLQTAVRYGTLQKGVLIRAFKKTNVSIYRTMWKKMVSFEPSVFTATNEEGIERVRNEKYVVLKC